MSLLTELNFDRHDFLNFQIFMYVFCNYFFRNEIIGVKGRSGKNTKILYYSLFMAYGDEPSSCYGQFIALTMREAKVELIRI